MSCAVSKDVEQELENAQRENASRVPGFMLLGDEVSPGGIIEAIAPVRSREPLPESGAFPGSVSGESAVLRVTGPEEEGAGEYSATALRVQSEEFGDYYYFLIGIDSWAATGSYRMTLERRRSGEVFSAKEYTLPVESREFNRETIVLNNRLTGVRTNNSSQRQKEIEDLSELLLTVDSEGYRISGQEERRWPLDKITATSGFGDRRVYQYSNGKKVTSIHNGLDYRGKTGTAVFAPMGGRVVLSTERIVTGNTLVLEHLPGVYSHYYHLDQIRVSRGDEVSTGDEIAFVGNTGLATGSHLHWEFTVGAVAVDPDLVMTAVLLDSERLSRLFSEHQQ